MRKARVIATAVFSMTALILAACSSPPPPPPPAPPPPPPPIPGPQSISERSLLTLATDFAFGSGSYRLKHAGKLKLDELVPEINSQPPNIKITVYGYTDNRPIALRVRIDGLHFRDADTEVVVDAIENARVCRATCGFAD